MSLDRINYYIGSEDLGEKIRKSVIEKYWDNIGNPQKQPVGLKHE